MIKVDIVKAVVAATGVSNTKAEDAVETVIQSLKDAMRRGDRIELRRFGVFTVRSRKTGMASRKNRSARKFSNHGAC